MDEGNSVAENGVKGGVSFVEKNNLGTETTIKQLYRLFLGFPIVTTKQFLKLDHREKPHQASKRCIIFLIF